MTSVLLSIKPKYCELIANGKKTVEVRKTRPKIDVPFKCYIYCTKNGNAYNLNQNFWKMDSAGFNRLCNGRIIGEFVCTEIELIDCSSDAHKEFSFTTCLTQDEFIKYCNGKELYGWRISELKIYDRPKEVNNLKHWIDTEMWSRLLPIERPPQSWCYIEEIQG